MGLPVGCTAAISSHSVLPSLLCILDVTDDDTGHEMFWEISNTLVLIHFVARKDSCLPLQHLEGLLMTNVPLRDKVELYWWDVMICHLQYKSYVCYWTSFIFFSVYLHFRVNS